MYQKKINTLEGPLLFILTLQSIFAEVCPFISNYYMNTQFTFSIYFPWPDWSPYVQISDKNMVNKI